MPLQADKTADQHGKLKLPVPVTPRDIIHELYMRRVTNPTGAVKLVSALRHLGLRAMRTECN